jgi:uncharacterized protein YjbI with pentapeptide repeats
MKEWLASLPPIPVTTLLLYIFASVLSLLLLGYLVYLTWKLCRKLRRFWRSLDGVREKDRFEIKNDFIKTTAQILGGVLFIIIILVTLENLAVSQKNLVATQEKKVTELYTKAIEQLGSEKLEVRLGGIYALERIARDSKKDHWNIMEVLTAFVREKAKASVASEATPLKETRPNSLKKDTAKPAEQPPKEKPKPKADIQAVLNVLGRTAIPFAPKGEKRRLDLSATDLRGADLQDANLQGAFLREANFQGAGLGNAILQKADFRKVNLQGASLWEANLQGGKLWEANLQEAHLYKANLQGADLRYANFRGAHLPETNLQEAHLEGANLQGAILTLANLKGAVLTGANLQEAFLKEAILQGAHLEGANLQGAYLGGADLREAALLDANLQGAGLRGANLQGASLREANLQEADIGGAKLQGADLQGQKGYNEGTKGLTTAQVAGAYWDETTKWPEGFTPPAPRRLPPKEEK